MSKLLHILISYMIYRKNYVMINYIRSSYKTLMRQIFNKIQDTLSYFLVYKVITQGN